jgi:hypothetical protein
MEIIDIVNRGTCQQPFEPVIRKINRHIGQRSRFVFKEGKIVEEEEPERPTASVTDYGWQKLAGARSGSTTASEYLASETAASNKQTRINSVAEKLNGLAEMFREKRERALSLKFEALEGLLDKLTQQRFEECFKKLVKELSYQKLDLLSKKAIKPNYATMMKFMKSNLAEGIEKTEDLLSKFAKKRVVEELKTEFIASKMEKIRKKRFVRNTKKHIHVGQILKKKKWSPHFILGKR